MDKPYVNKELKPMLATKIEEEAFFEHFSSDDWFMQPKHNGYRGMIHHVNGTARLYTRAGPTPVFWKVDPSMPEFILDCEMFGTQLAVVFDLLQWDESYEDAVFSLRNCILENNREAIEGDNIEGLDLKITKTARGINEKKAISVAVRRNHGEGFIFRNRSSLYMEGHSKNLLKYRLIRSCKALVIANDDNQSRISLTSKQHALTKCDIAKLPVGVKPGTIVKIMYNYQNPDGKVVGASYLKTPEEQHFNQLNQQDIVQSPQF